MGEFNLRAPGVEATAKRREKAAALLGAAEATRSPDSGLGRTDVDPGDAAEALPNSRIMRRLQGSRILWVDDRPDNNIFERQALEALGVKIDLATSTEEALQLVRRRSYDLIISDMGRPQDEKAGFTLLDQLREAGVMTPFVIYSGSRAPEHVKEARRRGAIGATNSPQELVNIVTTYLARRSRD
jgi:CheY-like chemotaxis protein